MPNRGSDAGQSEENLMHERDDGDHRGCQRSVQPARRDATSPTAAIGRLIADIRAGGGLEIEFYDDVPIGELPLELREAVFPIVQELLVNACRHSKSKSVLVGLAQDDNCVCIQVQDWGIGFDPEMIQPHKRGLKGIRDVAQCLGGTVSIDSRHGAGTCVIIEIPLSQANGLSDPTCQRRPR